MHFQDSDIQKLLIQVNCLALQYLHGVMKLLPDYLIIVIRVVATVEVLHSKKYTSV